MKIIPPRINVDRIKLAPEKATSSILKTLSQLPPQTEKVTFYTENNIFKYYDADVSEELSMRVASIKRILQSIPPFVNNLSFKKLSSFFTAMSIEQRIEILKAIPDTIVELEISGIFYSAKSEERIQIMRALPSTIKILNLYYDRLLDFTIIDGGSLLPFDQRIQWLNTLPKSIQSVSFTDDFIDGVVMLNTTIEQRIKAINQLKLDSFPDFLFHRFNNFDEKILLLQDISTLGATFIIGRHLIKDANFNQRLKLLEILKQCERIIIYEEVLLNGLNLAQKLEIFKKFKCRSLEIAISDDMPFSERIELLKNLSPDVKNLLIYDANFFYDATNAKKLLQAIPHTVESLEISYGYSSDFQKTVEEKIAILNNVPKFLKKFTIASEWFLFNLSVKEKKSILSALPSSIHEFEIYRYDIKYNNKYSRADRFLNWIRPQRNLALLFDDNLHLLSGDKLIVDADIAANLNRMYLAPKGVFARLLEAIISPFIKLWKWLFHSKNQDVTLVPLNSNNTESNDTKAPFVISQDNRNKLKNIPYLQLDSLEEYFNKRLELYAGDVEILQKKWDQIISSINNGPKPFLNAVTEFIRSDIEQLGITTDYDIKSSQPQKEARELIFKDRKENNAALLSELRSIGAVISKLNPN